MIRPINWMTIPLGGRPHAPDPRDLLLKNYVDKNKLIEILDCPLAHDWCRIITSSGKPPEPDADPLGNDVADCSVFAAPGHMVKMIGQQMGDPILVTADMVLDAHSVGKRALDPGMLDTGFDIRAMLKIWRQVGLYGTRALAYALVDRKDADEVALASWLGCGTIGGFRLPESSRGQVNDYNKQLWHIPPQGLPKIPHTWGYQCVWCCRPSPTLDGGCSWGRDVYWTVMWNQQCCEERWMVIVDKWKVYDPRIPGGLAPEGFAFGDLLADAAARAADKSR